MLITLFAALANDVHPGPIQPSAVPLDGVGQGPALRWFAPTVKRNQSFLKVGRGIELDTITYMPDLGVTWNIDRGQQHHVRLGLMSAMATLTYRLELGAVHLRPLGARTCWGTPRGGASA